MSARKSISSVCLQCCSLIGTYDFFFRKEQMLHEPYELSTCVTVFFLNSSIIKVTEGSCCSLEIVRIEKNDFLLPDSLGPSWQSMSQLSGDRTQHWQRGQWSCHHPIFLQKLKVFVVFANMQFISSRQCAS